ncbi:hypothetical protein [Flavicella sediminum]|uniref:hypothetical protein n=1 Tax=Flavicella sediminum TaxID=2585141 RepID=UPI00111F759E|nr:hypothetical protein [Flavicella sediminum]
MNKIIFLRIIRAFVTLSFGGVLIGYLHEQDLLLAGILALLLAYKLNKEIKEDKRVGKTSILLLGTGISCLVGVLAEIWGIHNAYWTYHDLSNGREFPYWLPFAWAFTFVYFYRFEKVVFGNLKLKTLKAKLLVVMLIYAIFPTVGEMITIYMGVWTYHWEYQFVGVPLLAIFLLIFVHNFIFISIVYFVQKRKLKDPVFDIKKSLLR